RIRADAERQREGGHSRETGIFAHSAQPEMDVLRQVFNQSYSPGIAALLLTPLDASHGAQRGIARLLRRHAFGDVFLDLPIEVIAEFLIQLLLDLAAAKERAQPQRRGIKPVFETHLSSLLEWRHTRDGGGEAIPICSNPTPLLQLV